MRKITLGTSLATPQMKKNVMEAMNDNILGGSSGRFNDLFEKKICNFVGCRHAVAVCNGTLADLVALLVLKTLRPEKTEVIVPSLTFVSQIVAIQMVGLKPVFVDVGMQDFQIDVKKIEKKINIKTLAIMPTNLLGHECDILSIVTLAQKNNLFVLEDSCEAFGIKNTGHMATYSFFPSHGLTIGEGGAVITDDEEMAMLARKIRNFGRRSEYILDKFKFDIVGINAKLNHLSAAVGVAAIDDAETMIVKRRKNVEKLNEITGRNWYAFNPHCYPVIYDSEEKRNRKLIEFERLGIETRTIFSCLPTQEKVFANLGHKLGDFPVAEFIGRGGLYTPIHQNLSNDDIILIGKNL